MEVQARFFQSKTNFYIAIVLFKVKSNTIMLIAYIGVWTLVEDEDGREQLTNNIIKSQHDIYVTVQNYF